MIVTRTTLCRLLAILLALGLAASSRAQNFTYTFTSGGGGDGFNWPASPTGILNFGDYTTPQDVYIYNDTGNNIFFDQQYQVAGNSSRIDGDALWGNPLDSGYGYLSFDFFSLGYGAVQDVTFDFAWSESGVPATSDFLSIYIEDSDGRASFNSWQLNDTFTGFGGSTGYEDTIHLSTSYLIDDYENVDGGAYIDIAYMEVYVGDIAGGGPSAEYAIDNFVVNGGGGGELDPENSDIHPGGLGGGLGGIGTNRLRTASTSFFNFGFFEVSNEGTGATTYTVSLDPTSAPEFVEDSPPTNALINGGEEIVNGSGNIANIDTSNPSGDYYASATFHNDLNAFDPDEVVTYHMRILDPPSLTDDAGSTVQVHLDPDLFIANAAAGPHAGAVRASVKVTNRAVTGDGFQVNGLNVDDAVDPAEAEHATVTFDRYGRLNGTFTGSFSVDLAMTDTQFSFLNGAEPVPSVNWNLSYTLSTINTDSVALSTNDDLGPGVLGVNDAQTAATLLGGAIAANQNVSMALTADPGSNADLAGTPVELTFGSGNVDLYVLQFTYLDGNLPVGITESQLQVLFYDTLAGEWDAAVDGNSGGTTTFFNGSYDDYLATVGGGTLDTGDLGAFGVDTVNNHAWAILDHASIFGVGVLTAGTITGDLNGDGFVGIEDLNLVLGHWNQTVAAGDPLLGDPTGDGFVGIEDLNQVLGNWNAGTPPSGNSNIPEPSTLMLLMLGAAGLLKRA